MGHWHEESQFTKKNMAIVWDWNVGKKAWNMGFGLQLGIGSYSVPTFKTLLRGLPREHTLLIQRFGFNQNSMKSIPVQNFTLAAVVLNMFSTI